MNTRLTIVKGRACNIEGTLSTEVVVNWATCSLAFTVKGNLDDADGAKLLQKTVGAGITKDVTEEGRFVVALVDADFASFDETKTYFWDIVLKDGASSYELDSGIIEFRKPVLKSA